MLQTFDWGILQFLNGFVGKSALFDMLFARGMNLYSLKFLPITACMVWLWFESEPVSKRRAYLVQALIGAFIALVVSRLVQNMLPHRPRPLNVEELHLVLPFEILPEQLKEWNDWSSFPSDHAALAFALAIGIWRASRLLGWGVLIWSAVEICFPRVYAGFHYPSDVIGGALLGMLCTLSFAWAVGSGPIMRGVAVFERRAPGLLYAGAFIVLFDISTMFDDIRKVLAHFASHP